MQDKRSFKYKKKKVNQKIKKNNNKEKNSFPKIYNLFVIKLARKNKNSKINLRIKFKSKRFLTFKKKFRTKIILSYN